MQPGSSFAELYVAVWERWHDGSRPEALRLHGRMVPYVSYWMQNVELIVAAEKRISMLRGIIATETCREPGWSLDDHERDSIDAFLQEFHAELMSAESTGDRP